jgi:GAF domain-containing protein
MQAARRVLHADQVVVLDVNESGELEVRFSSPPLDGEITVPIGSGSFSGYIALARVPVLVEDLELDGRFEAQPVVATASAVGAPIFGPSGLCGVIAAGSSVPNKFNRGAVHFMQGLANVIGTTRLG